MAIHSDWEEKRAEYHTIVKTLSKFYLSSICSRVECLNYCPARSADLLPDKVSCPLPLRSQGDGPPAYYGASLELSANRALKV